MQALNLYAVAALTKSAWPAVGPLVGIYIGQSLSKSTQHQQWMRDCRKAEFEALVSALLSAALEIQDYLLSKEQNWPGLEACLETAKQALKRARLVIETRIYVAEDVRRLDVYNRFAKIAEDFHTSEAKANEEIRELVRDLVTAATAQPAHLLAYFRGNK